MSVRLAITAVVAPHRGLDDAWTVGLWQLVAILAWMADERERRDGCGGIHLGPAKLTCDGLADQRAKCVLVHTTSL